MANVVTPLPVRSAPTPATSSAAEPSPATPTPAAPSPAALTSAEIAALALSLAHLGSGPQADTARAGLRRILEITSDADPSVDDTIVATLTTLTTRLAPDLVRHARTIASAITARRVVRLSYRDGRGTVTLRDIEPVTCLVHRDHWYLVGWCRLRQAIRAFRFDRLLSLEGTDIPAPAHPAERFLPFQRRTH
jgi:predicted DNA-binding transcriptional regulator YafY